MMRSIHYHRSNPCSTRLWSPRTCAGRFRKATVVSTAPQRPSLRSRTLVASAAAGAQAGDAAPSKSERSKLLLLGLLFGGWYLFNIYFNIFNKQVLTAFHFPLTCTVYQFFIGSILGASYLAVSGTKVDTSPATIKAVLPLAAVHTVGNLLTNVSLGMVAVSFTHTIKAMEPLFSVALSALFLGQPVDPLVLATLVPIIGGVAGASLTEASFNWPGFLSAMGSNITFQSRNVFSKRFMTPEIKEKVGGSIGLFSLMTIFSFLLLAPVALLIEGVKFTPASMQALGIADPGMLLRKASIAAFMFHAYQQVSYMILSRVSPVTHSIGNCVKRVIVIVASVVIFKNPMSTQTAFCTLLALSGVFAYSQVKRIKGSTKAA